MWQQEVEEVFYLKNVWRYDKPRHIYDRGGLFEKFMQRQIRVFIAGRIL